MNLPHPRDNFPYWPPASPQVPAVIAGRQLQKELEDLIYNQIPQYRETEVPVVLVPFARVARAEYPAISEPRNAGRVGNSLYDAIMQSEATPPEMVIRAAQGSR